MSGADAEFFCEEFDAAVFESGLADQPQGAGDGAGGSEPSRSPGAAFRATAEAGAESGFGRGGCRGKVATIFFFGRGRGADGTAIDAAAEDSDEEFSIEARVARQASTGTYLPVENHLAPESFWMIVDVRAKSRRFRTWLGT